MEDTLVYVGFLLLPVVFAGALYAVARRRASGAGTQQPRTDRRREGGRRPRPGERAGARDATPAATTVELGWPRLVAVNFLVFLLLSSVVLLGLESYYRFVYDSTDSFGLTRTTAEWWMRHSHANKMVVRDDVEYALARTPGRPRVTFLGDSFTAGHGIADVGDRFANLVRKDRPAWEIHVLARSGLDTGAEVRFLQDTVRRGYELDRVVLVYCLNDISDIVPEWNAIIDRIKDKRDPPGFLVQHSYLANVAYYRLKAMRDPDVSNYYGFVRSAYAGTVWEKQRERLAGLKAFVDANGGRLLVVTFPFLHAVGPDYGFRGAHEKLGALWMELGVPHLDLLTVYGDLPSRSLTVGAFDAHPNEHASRLAANAIEKFLDGELPAN